MPENMRQFAGFRETSGPGEGSARNLTRSDVNRLWRLFQLLDGYSTHPTSEAVRGPSVPSQRTPSEA